MSSEEKFVLFFDGSCGPVNPGGIARCAWRLVGPDGNEVASDSDEICRGPGATNNLAEWYGLLRGLHNFKMKYPAYQGRLEIKGDSQLVICQLSGQWVCRKASLKVIMEHCLKLLEGVHWIAAWITREENAETDRLTHEPPHSDPSAISG